MGLPKGQPFPGSSSGSSPVPVRLLLPDDAHADDGSAEADPGGGGGCG